MYPIAAFRSLVFATPLLLLGCATPVYNYAPERTEISTPINEVRTVFVGEVIAQRGIKLEQEFLYVEEQTALGLFHPYTIGKGLYRMTGEDEESAFFAPENHFEGGGMMTKAALADPRKAVQAYKHEKRLCGVSVFNAQVCDTEAKYQFVSKPMVSGGSEQRELVYNGKMGSQIHIGYRESSGIASQPTVTNDVVYDLSESRTIVYKGVRVEIIEATNEFIKFRVLQGFGEAS